MVYPRGNAILDGEWQRLGFLGDNHPLQDEYDAFWPRSGSQQSWDAVGSALFGEQREWVLVEAKAHTGEVKDVGTAAVAAASKSMIREAFKKTQQSLACTVSTATWLKHYYQYANRLVALYFLNQHVPDHRAPARLVMIYFCDDTYDGGNCPLDKAGWQPTLKAVRRTLGLTGRSDLERRVHEVFVPVDLATMI